MYKLMALKLYETLITNKTVSKLFLNFIGILLGELTCRMYDALMEYIFNANHYDPKDRIGNILEFSLFSLSKRFKIVLCIANPLLLIWITNEPEFFNKFFDCLCISIVYFLGIRCFHIRDTLLQKAKWIRSGSGLDYGSGMASNYFHGYIHLQLPEKGDDKKDIKERCQDYEGTQQVSFATKKLIILIPHSMHTKPKIESRLLERAAPLETVMKDRAGVKRPFKNDVYRLTEPINGKNYYIVLEGATPLLSFYESCDYGVTSTPDMKSLKRDILFQFFRSIRKYCLNCPSTVKSVDFIYYNDYDINGEPIDVGCIVKDYIVKVLKEEQKLILNAK